MLNKLMGAALAAVTVLVLAGQPAWAGEKGKFRGVAALYSTVVHEVKAADGHPLKAAYSGDYDGVIFNDARNKFLHTARYQVAYIADGGGFARCYKTFTESDGSKVFAVCDGRFTAKGSEGTLELVGGTGRYHGIKGKGKFDVTNVTPALVWDLLEWEYEIP